MVSRCNGFKIIGPSNTNTISFKCWETFNIRLVLGGSIFQVMHSCPWQDQEHQNVRGQWDVLAWEHLEKALSDLAPQSQPPQGLIAVENCHCNPKNHYTLSSALSCLPEANPNIHYFVYKESMPKCITISSYWLAADQPITNGLLWLTRINTLQYTFSQEETTISPHVNSKVINVAHLRFILIEWHHAGQADSHKSEDPNRDWNTT